MIGTFPTTPRRVLDKPASAAHASFALLEGPLCLRGLRPVLVGSVERTGLPRATRACSSRPSFQFTVVLSKATRRGHRQTDVEPARTSTSSPVLERLALDHVDPEAPCFRFANWKYRFRHQIYRF